MSEPSGNANEDDILADSDKDFDDSVNLVELIDQQNSADVKNASLETSTPDYPYHIHIMQIDYPLYLQWWLQRNLFRYHLPVNHYPI